MMPCGLHLDCPNDTACIGTLSVTSVIQNRRGPLAMATCLLLRGRAWKSRVALWCGWRTMPPKPMATRRHFFAATPLNLLLKILAPNLA